VDVALFRWNFLVSNLFPFLNICINGSRYVAMHSMTEATNNPSEEPFVNGYIDHHTASNGLTKSDISLVMVGMLLPLLTQFGHAH
jgi:zinc transporter 9